MPFKPGDLVYIFRHAKTGIEKDIGIIASAEWPPQGSLQIPQIFALIDGRMTQIGFEEVRKVEDCLADGQKETVLEESPVHKEIGTLMRFDPDMHPDYPDDSVMLIIDVCPEDRVHGSAGGPPCYQHPISGLEWTDYVSDGMELALVLHPSQGTVWAPLNMMIPVDAAPNKLYKIDCKTGTPGPQMPCSRSGGGLADYGPPTIRESTILHVVSGSREHHNM